MKTPRIDVGTNSRMGGNVTDLTGQRFGRLSVVKYAGTRKGQALWRCDCECGVAAFTTTASLKSGKTQSCGCLMRERLSQSRLTHGLTKSPEYKSWSEMRQRCNNANNSRYADWGGRGIRVCEAWSTFGTFLNDMGRKPGPNYSIDRIDNDGDYCPSNCRWATKREQNRNTRRNRMVTFRGQTKSLSEWSDVVGISMATLWARLKVGVSTERALTQPVRGAR